MTANYKACSKCNNELMRGKILCKNCRSIALPWTIAVFSIVLAIYSIPWFGCGMYLLINEKLENGMIVEVSLNFLIAVFLSVLSFGILRGNSLAWYIWNIFLFSLILFLIIFSIFEKDVYTAIFVVFFLVFFLALTYNPDTRWWFGRSKC